LTTCQETRDLLARRAFAAAQPEDLSAAYRHVAACPACQDYLARFRRGILSFDADEVTCAEVRASAACLASGAAADRVRRHLVVCPACAVESAAWERIGVLQAQGALSEPQRYPTFDLSFLPQVVPIWQQIAGGVRRLGYEIPAALTLAKRSLTSPLPGLTFSFAPAPARLRGVAEAEPDSVVSLAIADPDHDVRILLHVSKAEHALWLAVGMSLLSSGRMLHGERVSLCNAGGQAQEIKTVRSGDGEARFSDLAPGQYVVRVEHSGRSWELPLSL
jgi:hypothetical protein